MNRLWWSLVCVLALGVTSACDDNGDGGTDAGPDTSTDAGGEEAAPVVLASVLDAEGKLTDQVEADFSCTPSEPAGTEEVTFDLVARSFGELADPDPLVAGITIQFFPNNEIPADGSCEAPCVEVTTDANGVASVTDIEGSWYAYRVVPGSAQAGGADKDFIEVVQYNEVAPAAGGDEATVNAIATSTQSTILALLSVTQEAGTGVITGNLVDCMGRPVSNARIRAFDSAGEIDLGFGASGPREFYFNGDQFPVASQRMTNTDGLYGAANLPVPSDNIIRFELWGVLAEGEDPTMLSCEEVQVNEGGITIMNSGPTRADGPSGCSGS